MRILFSVEEVDRLHDEYLESLDRLSEYLSAQRNANELQARAIQVRMRRIRARMTTIETMLANNYKEG